ncbi:MAG: DinB family protein [Anaerolineales bacterium]|nr:DinB family protein [Chloroflexota bacterium]MBL6981648.1 DinB family protein [Anaerolineales bacterium]
MKFDLDLSIAILERTPLLLESWLRDLPDEWVSANEGEDTWSPYDILGHFVHGEHTDWIPRARIILSDRADKTFEPFDRFAQFGESQTQSLDELLATFKKLRAENIAALKSFKLAADDFLKPGVHPELGPVNLEQLLATWVVHDLDHLSQITQVMARQYKGLVGPWEEYLGIL